MRTTEQQFAEKVRQQALAIRLMASRGQTERIEDMAVALASEAGTFLTRTQREMLPDVYVEEAISVPLRLLTSEKSQDFARKMRAAAAAALEVDKERGWYPDGPGERLGDWAEAAEEEAFGVKGLE